MNGTELVTEMRNSNGRPAVIMIAVIFAIIVGISAKPPSKIEGGSDVPPNGAPFVVLLRLCGPKECSSCTGAIISRRHVLTAGHCVDGKDRGSVYGGTSHRYDPNAVVRNIASLHKPAQYGNYGAYDIGIAEVDSDFEIGGRQSTIYLPTEEFHLRGHAFQFGWSTCGDRNLSVLQDGIVNFLPKETCNRSGEYPSWHCVEVASVNVCPGDSGGPILFGGRVVSITSERGYHWRRATNVYEHLDWIKSVIGQ